MNLKFQTKIVLTVIMILLVSCGWLSWQNYSSTKKMMEKELQIQGFALADAIDQKIKTAENFEAVLTDLAAKGDLNVSNAIKDHQELFSADKLLAEIEENHDVIYALLINAEGVAIAGTDSMVGTKYEDAVTIGATQKGERGSARWIDPESGIAAYDVQIPYYEGKTLMGSICVGISMKNMDSIILANLMQSLMVMVITLIVAALVILFAIRYMVAPLGVLSRQLLEISHGDFTIEQDAKVLQSQDELGSIARSVTEMRMKLSELLAQMKSSVEAVNSGSDQLAYVMNETARSIEENAKAVDQLAQSAQSQVNATEKAGMSALHLGSRIDESNQSIIDANGYLANVRDLTVTGEQTIRELASISNESITRSESVVGDIQNVEITVKDMNGFMGHIRSISEQTNLLALNASIEAARAGDAGRGFAVVAEEIRKLAEETKATTEQVEQIIKKVDYSTSAAADNIRLVSHNSLQQKEALQETLSVFYNIQTAIGTLVSSMEAVVDVNMNVAENKDEIVRAISTLTDLAEDLSATCHEISASSEEQASAVEEVNGLSETNRQSVVLLSGMIEKFKISRTQR